MFINRFSAAEEYHSFRCAVPLKRIVVDGDDSKVWSLYDAGPRNIKCPIICLPPAAGKSDVFFRQLLGLSGMGFRVIALDYPVYWTIEQFCVGLRKVIDHLNLDQVHIFGCSLGGYLALKFAERVRNSSIVASLVICNGFADTSVFKYTRASTAFWVIPAFILKRLIMGSLNKAVSNSLQAEATEFVVECLESLNQQEISSRLVLHCNGDYLRFPHSLQHLPVTLMDVFDESVLSQRVKDDMYKCFPNARRAHLKSGGNFPYLCQPAEVNLHLRLHCKQFDQMSLSPFIRPKEYPDPTKDKNFYQPQELVSVAEGSSFDDGEDIPKTLLSLSKQKGRVVEDIERDNDDEANDFPI